MKKMMLVLMLALLCSSTLKAQDDAATIGQWALTPPMGWNSWDCYGPTVVESEVKQNADYMAEHLLRYGWEYIVVDIRWFVENDKAGGYNQTNPIYDMDEYGRYIPAPNRFPSAAGGQGFKPLADYIHSKGLKFGIHIMRGLPKKAVEQKCPVLGTDGITCDKIYNNDSACTWLRDNYKVDYKKPGAQEYYNSIFNLYAEWGVDYVKVDDIARPYHTAEIQMIHNAIMQCGRPMVLSLSPGETPVGKIDHLRQNANMWRTVDDFWDNWSHLSYSFGICAKWAPLIQPGHWPDADMLPLGHISIRGERGAPRYTSFTKDEQYSLMNLWTIFHSPLMFGGELNDNDEFTNSLLTNEDVLYMHRASVNNRQVSSSEGLITWSADDPANDDKFAALFNTNGQEFINSKAALWRSGIISYLTTGYQTNCEVDLPADSKFLLLAVTDGGDGYDCDHADWINAMVEKTDGTTTRLTALTPIRATSGWNAVQKNKSVNGTTLSVNGKKYTNGWGTHANSLLLFKLPDGAVKFTALCGLDNSGTDQGSKSSVEFLVYNYDASIESQTTDANAGSKTLTVDPSKQAATSGYISRSLGLNEVTVEADIEGAEKLYLVVTNGGDNFNYDHADWGNPVLIDADGNETSLTTIAWDADPINGWYAPKLNTNNDGNTMVINGTTYTKGFGVNSPSMLTFTLPEDHEWVKFRATVGYDDDVKNQSNGVTMEFHVFTQDPTPASSQPVTLDLEAIGCESGQLYRLTDMWSGEDLGTWHDDAFTIDINSHGSRLLRVSPTGEAVGIDQLQAESQSAKRSKKNAKKVIYTLDGAAHSQPVQGINIVEGKKVLVK